MISNDESASKRWEVTRYSNEEGKGYKALGNPVFVDAVDPVVALRHVLPVVPTGWQFAQDGRSSVAIRGKQLVRAVLYHYSKEKGKMQHNFTVVSGTWYHDADIDMLNVKDTVASAPFDDRAKALDHAQALVETAGPDQYVMILTWEGKTNIHTRRIKEAAILSSAIASIAPSEVADEESAPSVEGVLLTEVALAGGSPPIANG